MKRLLLICGVALTFATSAVAANKPVPFAFWLISSQVSSPPCLSAPTDFVYYGIVDGAKLAAGESVIQQTCILADSTPRALFFAIQSDSPSLTMTVSDDGISATAVPYYDSFLKGWIYRSCIDAPTYEAGVVQTSATLSVSNPSSRAASGFRYHYTIENAANYAC